MPRRTLFLLATIGWAMYFQNISSGAVVFPVAEAFVAPDTLYNHGAKQRRRQTAAIVGTANNNQRTRPSPLSYRNEYESTAALTVPWGMNATIAMSSCTVTGDLDYNRFVDNYAVMESVPKSPAVSAVQPKQFRVYCDLDGVLVDFAHGISQVFGLEAIITSQNIDALPRGMLWDKVAQAPAFFEHLPWCAGGRELWQAIAPLRPHILTGVPAYCMTAPRDEKYNWCRREFARLNDHENRGIPAPVRFQHVDKAARLGPVRMHSTVRKSVHDASTATAATAKVHDDAWTCKVITCWSEQKFRESGPGAVLIDDRIDLKPAWEAQGGIFIHHETGNVDKTLRQLREHGVLPSEQDENDENETNYNDLWRRSSFHP